MVRVGDDLRVVDLDSPDEIAVLGGLLEGLRNLRLLPLVLASGQEGRRHIWVRVRSVGVGREVEALVVRLCGSRTPLRRDVRPPLSPHRLGLPTRLLEPSTVDQAIALLEPLPGAAGGRLSDRMFGVLLRGDTTGRYGDDRSAVVQAIATGAVHAGWSERRLYNALEDSRYVGGRKVQDMLGGGRAGVAERYVHECYEKAVGWVAANPAFEGREDAVEALLQQQGRVRDHHWRGASGSKQRVVLDLVVARALALGSKVVHMSTRHVAEECGMSRATATKVLDRLVEDGWLVRHQAIRGRTHGYEVVFTTPSSEPLSSHPPTGEVEGGPTLSVSHPAFAHGAGLGKNGHRVLSYLEVPLTAGELSSQTGVPASSVRAILNLCQDYRIVLKTGRVWSLNDPVTVTVGLSLLARDKDTYRNTIDRRRRHQIDREQRRATSEPAGNLASSAPVRDSGLCGWVNPATSDFQQVTPVPDDHPAVAEIGPLVLTFRHRGHEISLCGPGGEVVWTDDAHPDRRLFPVSERHSRQRAPEDE